MTLDLYSHRLDAWITALVSERLAGIPKTRTPQGTSQLAQLPPVAVHIAVSSGIRATIAS